MRGRDIGIGGGYEQAEKSRRFHGEGLIGRGRIWWSQAVTRQPLALV